MEEIISLRRFNEIDLNDPFLDSLKTDYPGFEEWFIKKSQSDAQAYVQYNDGRLQAFLYLKDESGTTLEDVSPKGLHAVD